MPNEKSSSFSSSNLCFWASARMLYVICLVSIGVRDGRSSGRSLPCILILGAEPAVICRSEPFLSIITFKRSCRLGTFLGSVVASIIAPYFSELENWRISEIVLSNQLISNLICHRCPYYLFYGSYTFFHLCNTAHPQCLHPVFYSSPF